MPRIREVELAERVSQVFRAQADLARSTGERTRDWHAARLDDMLVRLGVDERERVRSACLTILGRLGSR